MTAREEALQNVVIGVVGVAPEPSPAIAAAVEAAGAVAVAYTEATALAGSAMVDAVVFDAGSAPERLVHLALALDDDPRTRHAPRVLVVDGGTAAERIAPFGTTALVIAGVAENALAAAVADAVAKVRAQHDGERRLQKSTAERRIAEQQLDKVRDDAGTLAHDARVLFGVILGYAGNLRDGIAGPITDLQRKHVLNIAEASTDAAGLLERYLLAVRPTADETSPHGAAAEPQARQPRRRQTDLGELVRSTVVLLGGVAAAKQIRVTTDVARGVPNAWCDAMQIKQALVNLLSNALKLTPPFGFIEVAVRHGAPGASRAGSAARREVELVVSDSGPGIPIDDRERVFERGVRLERDEHVPGTGIGLSVVRDVVEQHGGEVRIDETPGGGASFVLTLPSDLRARASDRPHAFAQVVTKGPR